MEFARIELVGEDVKGIGVLAEVVDVEDRFGVGKIKAGKIAVQASLW